MDSKSVNRSIRSQIWPLLEEAGFSSRTSRSAWRHQRDRVDVVNFQSFNSYTAGVMGVTSFSFAVNLGTYLRYVPPQWPAKKIKDGVPFPAESECQFRGRLRPLISQSHKNDGVWGVDVRGSNLAWCINDVASQIPAVLAWFKRFESREEVLRILLGEDESMPDLWGFGRRPSPIRSYLTGYVAMAVNDDQLANREFKAAVASGCFSNLFSSVEGARYRAA
jgi:hypothetical protein